MLRPTERTLLLDAVRPDPGFRLGHGLITTYSLNLTAALSVPLALTFHDWEEADDGMPRVDPVGLLEALRANACRLTILCQAGEIAVPSPQRNLFAFLERAVVPVSAPLGGVFHPKVWVLRYEAIESSEVRYRVLCTSRNLTFDRSWDVLLNLDGRIDADATDDHEAGPLADFVAALLGIARDSVAPIDAERSRAIERIAAELGQVAFAPPEKFRSVGFHPLGIGAVSSNPFAGRRDRMLVVSPFLSDSRLARLASGIPSTIVSTQAELDQLNPETLGEFDEALVLSDLVDSEPLDCAGGDAAPHDNASAPRLADSAEGLLRGLHAKVYVADAGHSARVWVGSANATEAAFNRNVEMLVELEGTKWSCGVDKVLGSSEDGGLRSLLGRYRPGEEAEADPDEREAEQRADAAAHALGTTRLELHVSGQEPGLGLGLRAPGGLPAEIGGVTACVWPITLSAERACVLDPDAIERCRWSPLELEQLTAFLGASVEARVGRVARVERRVTLRGELHGLPEDRDGAIIRAVLSSRENVLRYLAFLLANLDGDPAEALGMGAVLGPPPAASDTGRADGQLPLLEGLVRALACDPARIDRVEDLIGDLTASEEGRELLPAGFEEVFEPIRRARARLRGARR